MSQDTWELVSHMADSIELQMALQCAPLITGLKISNLLTISPNHLAEVEEILAESNISLYPLLEKGQRLTVLLYRRQALEVYLADEAVLTMLRGLGYEDLSLFGILARFRSEYERYAGKGSAFPHEMGLLLGYPVEDVAGFIEHGGRESLYTGYWKVYADKEKKIRLFEKFEYAKENLVQLLHLGLGMSEIIAICAGNAA